MNDKAILCSRNTATRLAGVLDIMGNQVIETEFGFHVNKGQDSEVYLKYSKNHKDSIEAVMLLNKLLPVSDGLQGLLGVALYSFMECLAIVLAENENAMLDNPKQKHAFHGLYRSLVHNMVVGVSEGYKKELELVGVGYRASNQGNIIELALGYTHSIFIQLPPEVKVETKSERNKNPLIILESCDKQLLGQVCSKIRSFRKPEPYKGKGIKFVGEEIRRKSGKSAGAK